MRLASELDSAKHSIGEWVFPVLPLTPGRLSSQTSWGDRSTRHGEQPPCPTPRTPPLLPQLATPAPRLKR
jgi:hypothetical protein